MSFIKPENAAQVYVTQMQNRLQELIAQLEEHAHQVEDAKAQELFEKSAYVLTGLTKVFADYADSTGTASQDLDT
jgi:hypothetical protein